MADSVYIHIPFCTQKCKYCSFVSFTKLEVQDAYIESLLKEIESNYKGEPLKTLYFGGGTPSLMPVKSLKQIIDKFVLQEDCEITLELNPDDANLKYLKELRGIGFNRLSIGSQTFDNSTLNLIGRRHSSEQTINAVKLSKEAGFSNISLDLIYGLPNQTMETLKQDLETILSLEIQHISTYGLKIEEDSYWGKHFPENLPDDDMQADMYLFINEYFEKNNYKRYEISNFSLKGFESRHNLNYWNNEEYYGFGVAAHGYNDGVRYANLSSLNEYLNNPLQKFSSHLQSEKEKLEEEIFLGFRKDSGINIQNINKKFNINFEEKYKKTLGKYIPDYIIKTPSGYKLTLNGVLLSNNILTNFI